MKIRLEQLEDFARGAAFLGTGGGGDPYIGRLLAKHAMQTCGEPEIIAATDLSDNDWVFPIAMLGAPTVLVEKGACGDDIDVALKQMAAEVGAMPKALIPFEIGGVNSCIPLVAAARSGLPVVNADGMGRAFPELQMVSFNVYGVSASPVIIVDEHLNNWTVRTSGAKTTEDFVRAIAIQAGLSVVVACFPMRGHEIKKFTVPNTMTLALGIGQAIAAGRRSGDPVNELVSYLRTTDYYNQSYVLFDGKITDLQRETKTGFSIGTCLLTELEDPKRVMEIQFQNENLVARINGRTVAIVPDLICIVDRETAEPITTEGLRYGQRVKVVGASIADILRTPEALKIMGPREFGLDEDFSPIETLVETVAYGSERHEN